MSGSVNRVLLIGRLGKDPESRAFQNGGKVCNFSLATSESWKDKQTGEKKELTEWHNIVITNESLAGIAERYLRKGSQVYLEGKLKTRKYTDKKGVERYTTEVVVDAFKGALTLLGSKPDSADDGDMRHEPAAAAAPKAQAGRSQADLDDQIPF